VYTAEEIQNESVIKEMNILTKGTYDYDILYLILNEINILLKLKYYYEEEHDDYT